MAFWDCTELPIYVRGLTTGSKKLLGAPVIVTRNKDATRGSWPYMAILLVTRSY